MTSKLISGVIYRIYSSGDSDKVVCIINTRGEKQVFIAKGAKKQNSRKAYSINLGNYVSIGFVEGYTVPIMTEIKLLNEFTLWKENYEKLIFLQFFCEIIDKFVYEENKEPELFKLVLDTLGSNTSKEKLIFLTAIFLLKTMYITGHLADLGFSMNDNVELNSENIYRKFGEVGYERNAHPEESEKISPRIYKTQRFMLNVSVGQSLKVNLEPKEMLEMMNLHIDWAEIILNKEFKSKKVLYNLIIKN